MHLRDAHLLLSASLSCLSELQSHAVPDDALERFGLPSRFSRSLISAFVDESLDAVRCFLCFSSSRVSAILEFSFKPSQRIFQESRNHIALFERVGHYFGFNV